MKRLSLELATLFYGVAYLPYIVLTRMMATIPSANLGRPLTGLEILPSMLIIGGVATYLVMWLAGWTRAATHIRVLGVSMPFASRWTALSGVFTAVILFSVPLSYTFVNVSVPFIQLLMRGDLLVIAPLVDFFARRRVRWWSWVALALVAAAILMGFRARGSLALPPLALFTVIAYTAAYFGRLWIMTKIAKDGDPIMFKRFFSEEKIVAFPLAIGMLALLALFGSGASQSSELQRGFIDIWTTKQIAYIAVCGAIVCLTGVFSAVILLDRRENSFCVPLERAASILAGVFGSVVLALVWGAKMATTTEFAGAALLIIAILILSFGPRLGRGRVSTQSAPAGSTENNRSS